MSLKNKERARLALAELEKEMELLTKEQMNACKGGGSNVLRDLNGNIIYKPISNGMMEHSGKSVFGEYGYIFANDGTPILVFDNYQGQLGKGEGFDTNCHGAAYLDGKYWLNDPKLLLQHDGYKEVKDPSGWKVGDKAVYYDGSGVIQHSMTISDIDSSGNITVYGDAGSYGYDSASIEDGYPGGYFRNNPHKVFRNGGDRILSQEEYDKFIEKGYNF